MAKYGISVEGDLTPSPELRLLKQTRLLKQPLTPSDRLTFDPEANEVQLATNDRIISYSLDKLHYLPELFGVTWSYVRPGPDGRDVFMLLARGMIVQFEVARAEPEVWHRTIIPLSGLRVDLERAHADGFGVYREGSQTILLLPGTGGDDRAWEFHFPDASHNYLRVHPFPLPLPQDRNG